MGMDVHQGTMAIAYVAHALHAAVSDRGALGTRQGDLAQLI
jgi:hypothetical protein